MMAVIQASFLTLYICIIFQMLCTKIKLEVEEKSCQSSSALGIHRCDVMSLCSYIYFSACMEPA